MAELIMCSFLISILLGVPVEPEVKTSTMGLSEVQDKRNSPMECSKSFPWTKLFAVDSNSPKPRGIPFSRKSGWTLCQFFSIFQHQKFLFPHHFPEQTSLPVLPSIFFGKDQQQYGIDNKDKQNGIPTQTGLRYILVQGIGLKSGPIRRYKKGRY